MTHPIQCGFCLYFVTRCDCTISKNRFQQFPWIQVGGLARGFWEEDIIGISQHDEIREDFWGIILELFLCVYKLCV